MAAALLAALLTMPGQGNAQTITNTARATWVQGGETRWVESNRVDTPMDRAPLSIDLLHPLAGAAPVRVEAPICGGNALALLPGGGSGAVSLPAEATGSVRVGEILMMRITAPLANRDPAAIDTLAVTIASAAGDREALTIFETGANTGVFIGAIRTASIPPTPVAGDCRLSVRAGDTIEVTADGGAGGGAAVRSVATVLADPFGIVFDSVDGTPVSGARVTMIDAATGNPAQVFAEDGVTPWPSTVVTGAVTYDAAGRAYPLAPGEFRFPLSPFGAYRLRVEPPSPYTAPSKATPGALAGLTRPDGAPFLITDASYGAPFPLVTLDAVRVDVPVDRPGLSVTLTKSASRHRAQPGDAVHYTLTITNPDTGHPQRTTSIVDTPSPWLRLRRETLRIDGVAAPDALSVSDDGRRLTIDPGTIAPGATVRVTYAMTLRGDTPPGQAVNRAEATDHLGNRAVAESVIVVERDTIAGRMTLIGRVALGNCTGDTAGPGIPGVRVMLEDGSFAITDRDGRYHFEGIVPGTHVVAIAPTTLPAGAKPVDCDRSTRSGGSAISRFVIGRGGSLAVADFHADLPGWSPPAAQADPSGTSAAPATGDAGQPVPRPNQLGTPMSTAISDRAAAGGEADWFALGDGPTDFLFPSLDHNPRIPSIRAVIRHHAGQRIALKINGKPVDPLAFEGTRGAPGNRWGVSVWRGIPLSGERNVLAATVTNADGSLAVELERVVHFVSAPWRAEIVPAQSTLVADDKTRPVVAVRFTDRKGNPVRSGVTGAFSVAEPYQSAAMIDQLHLDQLTGQGSASANWTIAGDEGIALIELAPTMVSGPLHLDFNFAVDELTRVQRLDSWVVPGDLPFTLVGLAEASLGARNVADQMERGAAFDSDLDDNARVAFYAKGRVLGKALLTVAYDSAKEKDAQRLMGAIDPSAYYTIYADAATRRYDAASTEKLYVRLETAAFYALYGDFLTGFDQTVLARYQRTMTGVKAESRVGALHLQGYAARAAGRHRRDEIQGAGISGPYPLADRNILANSERVSIEVRDRMRSELVVSRRELVRFIDYDIDLLAGTIRFKEPVLSRDFDLNPQFIVIDYEAADGLGEARWNGGLRADVTVGKTDSIRIGASAISDRGDGARSSLGGVDLRARIGAATEIRAEAAMSRREGETAAAWLVEAEHHTGRLDVLAYARSTDRAFGTGQQSGVELGRRKLGVDGRFALSDKASFVARGWHDDSLTDAGRRVAVEGDFVYRGADGEGRIGIAYLSDRLADGSTARSTVLQGQATRRLLDGKLELGVGTAIALGGTESIDLPTRHSLRARYAVSDGLRLLGTYEIAQGAAIEAQSFNLGFEIAPWQGARVLSSIGRQDIAEAGSRSYAAFGLAQSLTLSPQVTFDVTLDGNRKLGGADARDLVNPMHPVAGGGHLGAGGSLFEDFTAATLGLGWRKDDWAATLRGEWRDGEFATRKGVTAGVIRQLGDGVTLGSGGSWTRADGLQTASTEVIQIAVAGAYRPADSGFAALGKLEYRGDRVADAINGQLTPVGRTALAIDGDARSDRLVASLSTNWRDVGKDGDDRRFERAEIGVFLGARYNFDSFEGQGLASTALLAGLDARLNLDKRVEVGAAGTVRANMSDGTTQFAFGPQVGIAPAHNTLVTLGYNFAGFRDADFAAARHTERGIYASVRVKFDSDSFGFLGLGR